MNLFSIRTRWITLVAATVAIVSAWPSAASAQDPTEGDSMRPRIALRPVFGFSGNAKLDRFEREVDLETTYGGAIELEAPILPFFSLGGEVAVLAWTTEPEQDLDLNRNVLTDVSVVPRLRIPFEGKQMHGAMYLGVPIGFSINVLDDSYDDALDIVGTDVRTGVGYNVGARVGAQLFFTPNAGLTAELEYRYHHIRHRLDATIGDDDHVNIKLRQLMLQVGVIFAI